MREEYPAITFTSHEAVVKKYWPGRKLKLDKACLRGGYRSLRPLQKSKALCLHGRRRPRRETRREPGMTTGIALSNLYRVRERREGPESLPGLGLAAASRCTFCDQSWFAALFVLLENHVALCSEGSSPNSSVSAASTTCNCVH